MSKHVKNLVAQEISKRLAGVEEALLVNIVGLDANQSVVLRKQLREKNISLFVVKNSLAKRAIEGTPLAAAIDQAEGSLAVVWGGEDIVWLAKEIVRLDGDKGFDAFKARGGVMEGEVLTADGVRQISKWPSRTEQLSILTGQVLSVGSCLSAALLGPGRTLGSQIKQKSEEQ